MNIFYILISIILYVISFPKFNFWWFAFVALTPFFLALENAGSAFKSFLYAILWSVGFSFGMGYWVFPTILNQYEVPFASSVLFFTLCVILPTVMIFTLFSVLYRFFYQNRLSFYALVVPSIWVLAEYLKDAISFLIPWGGIDGALVPFSQFIQIGDLAGGYGIMFIVVAANALFVYFIKQLKSWRTSLIKEDERCDQNNTTSIVQVFSPLILILLLIVIPVVYGMHQIREINLSVEQEYTAGRSIKAVLAQGNFSTKERWSGMGFYQRVMNYLEMSKDEPLEIEGKEGQGDSRVIVWPENTLNSSSKLNDALFMEIMRNIGENALLISGGLKTDHKTNEVFNSAYFISGTGRLLRYDKNILLPYSETSPLIDLLDAYYSAPSEFAAGQTPLCINAPEGNVGVSICFEILYPGFIRQSVKHGAQYLVNISNDSWFGDSPMPYIHLNAARLRAIENRRFLLRTSNSGISAVISPTGKVTAQSRLFAKERVDGSFVKLDELSFYARHGNLILFGAALILLIALVEVIFKKD
ncbi:MAG: apolipoprotein N-acyltransferase [Desulfobacteraceae bacterium]|jgi:apolipoprotein N-acyltransferase|nr:apolipoprotein N-acyltransferase [Desulfobacteraceae bacterium]